MSGIWLDRIDRRKLIGIPAMTGFAAVLAACIESPTPTSDTNPGFLVERLPKKGSKIVATGLGETFNFPDGTNYQTGYYILTVLGSLSVMTPTPTLPERSPKLSDLSLDYNIIRIPNSPNSKLVCSLKISGQESKVEKEYKLPSISGGARIGLSWRNGELEEFCWNSTYHNFKTGEVRETDKTQTTPSPTKK